MVEWKYAQSGILSVLQILAAAGTSFAKAHLLGEFWSLHSRRFGCDYFLAHAAQAARACFSLCLQMLTLEFEF
jgi:hypothetical protein